MNHELTAAIAVVVVAGVASQLIARAVRIPSVLVLLPVGIVVGPVTHLLDPSRLFADALYPVIAVAVGLVLFEGAVGLRITGAHTVRRPVTGLVTIGVAVTLLVGGLAATLLLRVPLHIGFLLGAILVVSGPTVVLPLLDVVRLREPVQSILRWECIAIDPIGAVLAVGIFNTINDNRAGYDSLITLAESAGVGITTGAVTAFTLAILLRHHLIPDRLQSATTLAMVVGCFVLANTLSVEAGLFATTIMGITLANQQLAPTAHIAAFGEELGVLILGSLYIILGATASLTEMRSVALPAIGLLVVLLAIRPVAVRLSTIGAGLEANEGRYLSLIAPRGIIAASVSTLFAGTLTARGVDEAAKLAPVAFVVIIGSVLVTSILARPAAAKLHVAATPLDGILLAGSQPWMISVGETLARNDVPVLIADADNSGDAARAGLLTFTDPLDSVDLHDALAAVGVGVAVIGSGNAVVDSYLVDHLSERLGRRNVYRVSSSARPLARTDLRFWARPVFERLSADNGLHEWEIVEIDAADGPVGGRLIGDTTDNDTGSNVDSGPDVVPLFCLEGAAPPTVITGRRVPRKGRIIAARSTGTTDRDTDILGDA